MRVHYRLKLTVPLVLLAGLAVVPAAQAGVPPAAGFTSLCGAMSGTQPATVSHVMFILLDNKSYSAIVGRTSAPYINTTLIPDCGLATNYHNYSHPSTPNYLGLTSGTAQGKGTSVDCTPFGCPQTQDSIFSQTDNAGCPGGSTRRRCRATATRITTIRPT